MNTNLNCYGNFNSASDRCHACLYLESCRYYARTAASIDRRSKITSYERIGEWLGDAADFDHIPGEIPGDAATATGEVAAALGRFFRYLLELDDYSIGLISEIVAPSEPRRQCTVSELGRIHGCSRQAMHRKLLQLIGSRPELASLLKDTMYKLSAGRQRFLRRRRAGAEG